MRTPSSPASSGRSAAICRSDRPKPLRLAQQGRGERRCVADLAADLVDQRDLVDEPRVDAARGRDLLDRATGPQGAFDDVEPAVPGHPQLIQQPGQLGRRDGEVVGGPETGRLGLHRAQRLAERLGEVAAERHPLADRLHRGGQLGVGAGELLEGEPRHLDHDVVQGRLERGGRLLGDVVGDLVEGVADRQLGGDLGDREAGRLAGQGAGPRHPRVHLDDDQPAGRRLDRELDVAAAGVDADRPQHVDAEVAHLLVLAVGQGHRRCDGDAVAGVHAHRVDVLDRADDHDVVVAVAHQLELELLPAEHALLDQHLVHRAGGEAGGGDPAQVLLVVRHARTGAAHGVRRPDDDRVAEVLDRLQHRVEGVADRAARHVATDRADDLLEPLPVLAALDGVDVGADQLDGVLLQDPALVQLDRDVEGGLPAQRRQDRVRPFDRDDLLDVLRGERLDVGRVGELGVGHDRRRVGVDQADPQPLGAQDPAGLGAGVVELAGLPDHDRAGADDQDVLDVGAPRHQCCLPVVSASPIRSANRSNR